MNEHQLLCFLTVSRTLNFSAAARELYCTQPALSYQIRQPRKGAGRRTVPPYDDAGGPHRGGPRPAAPCGKHLPRHPHARTVLKGFGTQHTLTLRLPPVLLQRDPIYPILMARLHAALPGYEFKVDTTPVPSSYHHMLCTEADAALYLPFGPLPPEIRCETIIGNRFYLITAPEHPFSGQSSVELSDLAGQQIFYEPLYQDMVDFAQKQPGMPYSTPVWRMVENYESVYAELLAGRGMFLCPMIYRFPCRVAHPAASVHPGHPPSDPAG